MAGDFNVTVGTTSTSVLAANASRKGTYLRNTSPYSVVYVMVGAAATLSNGVRLNPNGGFWFTPTVEAINAITASGVQPNGSAFVATVSGSWA